MRKSIVWSRVLLALLASHWLILYCVFAVDLTITVSSKNESEFIISGASKTNLRGVTIDLREDGSCAALNDFNVTAAEGGPAEINPSSVANKASIISNDVVVVAADEEPKPLFALFTDVANWCISKASVTLSNNQIVSPSPSTFEKMCLCTPPPEPSPSSKEDGLNRRETIGIIIAVLFIFGLVGTVVYAGMRRRNGETRARDIEANETELQALSSGEQAGSSRRHGRPVELEMVPLRTRRESPPSSSSSDGEDEGRPPSGGKGKERIYQRRGEIGYEGDDEVSSQESDGTDNSDSSSSSTGSYHSARSTSTASTASTASASTSSSSSSSSDDSSLSANDSDSETQQQMTESEIRRALRVGAPAASDKRKPPRTMEERIMAAYLKSIAEHPETRMDEEDERAWLASQQAKIDIEKHSNELRGSDLTSEESSHYSSASEMLSSSSGEEFDHSSGSDSQLSADEERLHETLSQSYGALLIQRTEMQVLSGGSSSDTSDKERSATDEEQGAAEETNDEEPPTEAA